MDGFDRVSLQTNRFDSTITNKMHTDISNAKIAYMGISLPIKKFLKPKITIDSKSPNKAAYESITSLTIDPTTAIKQEPFRKRKRKKVVQKEGSDYASVLSKSNKKKTVEKTGS